MIREMIQEYLVGLGVEIDKPGFERMDGTLKKTEQTVSQVTGAWMKNFTVAGTVIGGAIAAVTTAAAGLITSAAKQDLELEKLSRRMLVTKDAALEMTRATDALGESLNDILLSPELTRRFQQLTAEGRKMEVGGDFKETMQDVREAMFEFARLKQEAAYALTWIGYYLAKYLSRPMEKARQTLKDFNDSFIKNMGVWTEKIARGLFHIVNVGLHFLQFLMTIGKAVKHIWDAFPKGVKVAIAALTAFSLVLKTSPVGRMILLISALLLLLDDYYGYMEGKNAAFGAYWDKLNEGIETASGWLGTLLKQIREMGERVEHSPQLQRFLETVKALGESLSELGGGVFTFVSSALKTFLEALEHAGTDEAFSGYLSTLADLALDIAAFFSEAAQAIGFWLTEMAGDEALRDFLGAVAELVAAVYSLYEGLFRIAQTALTAFFGGLTKSESLHSFSAGVRGVVGLLAAMYRNIAKVIRGIGSLFKALSNSNIVKSFFEDKGRVVRKFLDIVSEALGRVGLLGRAVLALVEGDFSGVAKLAKRAFGSGAGIELGSSGGAGGKTYSAFNGTATEMSITAWNEAQRIGAEYDVNPALIYGQWYHETEGFTSDLARSSYNLGGLTQVEPNGEENKQPDGGNYYMEFSSLREYADYFARVWGPYIQGIKDSAEYASRLKEEGYYGDYLSVYQAGIENGMDNLPANYGFAEQQAGDFRQASFRAPQVSQVDPLILTGMLQGYRQMPTVYGGGTTTASNVVYQVNVGGVTVNGANASPKDIGQAAAEQIMTKLERQGQYILRSRAMNGVPILA
ncbi:MAG: glucosaminidase domain-containing protein [Schwartzia sp. (in: firmicutes)]